MAKKDRITPVGEGNETPNLDLLNASAGKPKRTRIIPSVSLDLTDGQGATAQSTPEKMGYAVVNSAGKLLGASAEEPEIAGVDVDDNVAAGGRGSYNERQASGNYGHLLRMNELIDRVGAKVEEYRHVAPDAHAAIMKDISLAGAHIQRAMGEHVLGNTGIRSLEKPPMSAAGRTVTRTDALGKREVTLPAGRSLVASSAPGNDKSSVRTDAIAKERTDRGYGDSLDQIIKETPGLESEVKYQGSASHAVRAAAIVSDVMDSLKNLQAGLDDVTVSKLKERGIAVPAPWSGTVNDGTRRGPTSVTELAQRTADGYVKSLTNGEEGTSGLSVHLGQEIEPNHGEITRAFNRVKKSRDSMTAALTAQWQLHKSIIQKSYDNIFKPLINNRVSEARQKNVANMQQFREQYPKNSTITDDALSTAGMEYERPKLPDYKANYVDYKREKQMFPERAHSREITEAHTTSQNAMDRVDEIEKKLGSMGLSPELHDHIRGIIAEGRAAHAAIGGHMADAEKAAKNGELGLPVPPKSVTYGKDGDASINIELDPRSTNLTDILHAGIVADKSGYATDYIDPETGRSMREFPSSSYEATKGRAKLAAYNLARETSTDNQRSLRISRVKNQKALSLGTLGRIKGALTGAGVEVPKKPTLIQPDLTGIPSLETYQRASGFNPNAMDFRGNAVPNPDTKPATMTEAIRYAQNLQAEGEARAAAPAPATRVSRSVIFDSGRSVISGDVRMGETPEMAISSGPTPSPKRGKKLARAAANKLGRGMRRGRMGANQGIDIGQVARRPELDEFGIFRPGMASSVSAGTASLSELAGQGEANAPSMNEVEPGAGVKAVKATRRTAPKAAPVVFEGPKTVINPAAATSGLFNDRRNKKK
jgi:hypothetical protein